MCFILHVSTSNPQAVRGRAEMFQSNTIQYNICSFISRRQTAAKVTQNTIVPYNKQTTATLGTATTVGSSATSDYR